MFKIVFITSMFDDTYIMNKVFHIISNEYKKINLNLNIIKQQKLISPVINMKNL